jgi:molecular chaperone GrpE
MRQKINKIFGKMDNTNTQQQQGDSSSNENEEINMGKVDSSESIPTDSGENNESAFAEEGTVTSNGDDEVTKLQLQVADLNDKYLRLYSEFDNYRRRTAKEKIDLSKTAGESFFNAVLPVMDDFERGLKAMDEAKDIVALKEGVDLIYRLINILSPIHLLLCPLNLLKELEHW